MCTHLLTRVSTRSYILFMEHYIGIRELRGRIAEVVSEVDQGETYIVERSGHSVAAVVPLDVYNSMRSQLKLKSKDKAGEAGSTKGPYAALLSLAGTMSSGQRNIGRSKKAHLADIYAGKRRSR